MKDLRPPTFPISGLRPVLNDQVEGGAPIAPPQPAATERAPRQPKQPRASPGSKLPPLSSTSREPRQSRQFAGQARASNGFLSARGVAGERRSELFVPDARAEKNRSLPSPPASQSPVPASALATRSSWGGPSRSPSDPPSYSPVPDVLGAASLAAQSEESWGEVLACLQEVCPEGSEGGLDVEALPANWPAGSAEETQRELLVMVQQVRQLTVQIRDAKLDRDNEAQFVQQLQEAIAREEARREEAEASLPAVRSRVAELAKEVGEMDAASAYKPYFPKFKHDADSMSSENMELIQLECRAVQAQLEKARAEQVAVQAEIEARKRELNEGQPKLQELRDLLTARYVRNEELRAELEAASVAAT